MLTVEEAKRHRSDAVRRWEKKNPEKVKQYKRTDYIRMSEERRTKMRDYNLEQAKQSRQGLIDAMGGKCCRCGFDDCRALQVDHIFGGGGRERKTITNRLAYNRTVLANPEKYQLLCANCNWIKRSENNEYRWKSAPVQPDASAQVH